MSGLTGKHYRPQPHQTPIIKQQETKLSPLTQIIIVLPGISEVAPHIRTPDSGLEPIL
jgi:hypothetical protein